MFMRESPHSVIGPGVETMASWGMEGGFAKTGTENPKGKHSARSKIS